MVCEVEFLSKDELFQFDRALIDQVAFPVEDRYPEEIITNYFAWYGGMVQKFRPKRFLEIGVRYGYTAIVCYAAALRAAVEADQFLRYEYVGLDDESYPPSKGVMVGSCTQANQNFEAVGCGQYCHAIKWNSITQGIPPGIGTFDMIHIDGNHDTHGVLNDIGHCWPILNAGGFLLFDDVQMPPIEAAITQWLEEMHRKDEVLAVQFAENERGHCYVRKTGFTKDNLNADPSIALMFADRILKP